MRTSPFRSVPFLLFFGLCCASGFIARGVAGEDSSGSLSRAKACWMVGFSFSTGFGSLGTETENGLPPTYAETVDLVRTTAGKSASPLSVSRISCP